MFAVPISDQFNKKVHVLIGNIYRTARQPKQTYSSIFNFPKDAYDEKTFSNKGFLAIE